MELLLPEVAAHHRVAVLIDAINEVLAGHTDHASLPSLQVSIVHKTPFLHQGNPLQYVCTTTDQGGLATGSDKSVVTPTSNAARSSGFELRCCSGLGIRSSASKICRWRRLTSGSGRDFSCRCCNEHSLAVVGNTNGTSPSRFSGN